MSQLLKILPRGERRGREYKEEIIIDREKERSLSPRHRRPSPEPENDLIITRTKSGDHGVEREIEIRERERKVDAEPSPKRDEVAEREVIIRERERREEIEVSPRNQDEVVVQKRYVDSRRKRDKLWTEISKDLVLREALERSGYEFDETEDFYYVFEYLRYVSCYPLLVSPQTLLREV